MSYEEVMDRAAAAMLRSGRAPGSLTVVAVAKTKTPEEIMAIYRLGHRDFGENRARELANKAAVLPDDIRWHFVGALQSNKARLVRPVAWLLHSMDRVSLARAWLKGPGRPPPVLLQVDVGHEPQKSGVDAADVGGALSELEGMGIEVRGLMAIPPAPEEPEDSRGYFRRLADIRVAVAADHPRVVEVSMGMSDDFEVAIEEGASLIRIGRAIFGSRN